MVNSSLPVDDPRRRLRADCSRCAALCCVGPAFAVSADFAIDKPAGRPCPNLRNDLRCGIHASLRERGFPGCEVFDCFGAGQQLVQVTFGGRTWRETPELAAAQFAALPVMRRLHEMLWHLAEALSLPVPSLHPELRARADVVEALTRGSAGELAGLDLDAPTAAVSGLLGQVSTLLRRRDAPDRTGADLIGRDLRRTVLTDAGLRGAYLIAADLRGLGLGRADLLGADLRAADVRGADLSGCLFLTQPQVTAARGDGSTRLPVALTKPAHW
jgi:hypothetical protein